MPVLTTAWMELLEGRTTLYKVTDSLFQVKNRDQSETYNIRPKIPSCTCKYFTTKKQLCKHIFQLIEKKVMKWEDLSEQFRSLSWNTVDQDILQSIRQPCQTAPAPVDPVLGETTTSPSSDVKTSVIPASNVITSQNSTELPIPNNMINLKKAEGTSLKRSRRMMETAWESIKEEMYNVTDRNILNEARQKMEEIRHLLSKSTTKEDGLTIRYPKGVKKSPVKEMRRKIDSLRPLPKNTKSKRSLAKKMKAKIAADKARRLRFVNRYATPKQIILSSTTTTTTQSFPPLPRWGGDFIAQGEKWTLTNTCPIDNFFALLTIDDNLSEAFLGQPSTPDKLKSIIRCLQKKTTVAVNTAKMLIFNLQGMTPNFEKRVLDFWGNEHEMFLLPFKEIFVATTMSNCKASCPLGHRTCPQGAHEVTGTTVPSLPSNVSHWLRAKDEISPCERKFTSPVPHNAPVVYINNTRLEDGAVYVYPRKGVEALHFFPLYL